MIKVTCHHKDGKKSEINILNHPQAAAQLNKILSNMDIEHNTVSSEEFFENFFLGESKPAVVLRGMRKREGFTQKELAEKLGTTQSVVAAMETGLRAIGKNMAHRLAEILNADYRLFL
ncbi:MAG: helix-turn-helix transcriptional regulator [Oligoflexia bacterium]|nr:helix-turn-helix transcriptional regulator [Oligoflexia bacterium]